MPATTKRAAPAKRATSKPAAAKPAAKASAKRGSSALDGLEVSLDNAQKAITELRADLSAGGRRLVKDVEVAVKNARRDLKRTRKAIQSDLGDLGEALTPRRRAAGTAGKPAAGKPASKPAARKPAASRGARSS